MFYYLQLILSACSPFFEKLFEEDSRSHLASATNIITTKTESSPSSAAEIEREKLCSRHPLVIVLPEVTFIN